MDTYVNYSARDEAYSTPLDKIDVSDPRLYYLSLIHISEPTRPY